VAVHERRASTGADQPGQLAGGPGSAGSPGNKAIQLQLFYSYGSNPPLYPQWQAYFRQHQPPALIVWGKNDAIFPAEGAHPYKRDLKNVSSTSWTRATSHWRKRATRSRS